MKLKSKDQVHNISLKIFSNILELRKLSHKGIDVKLEKRTLLDLSESLRRLVDEKK